MTVKNVLKLSLTMMNRNDLVSSLSQTPLNSEVEKLLNCYNLVVSELCEEYLPLIYTETLQSTSGKYYFTTFTKTPLEIKTVFDSNGDEISYKKTPLYIMCDEPQITVSYVFYPPNAQISDVSVYDKTKISERILALGVAREFLLQSGLYEEALSFDNRFQQALTQVLLKNSGGIIRARSWF